MAVVPWTREIIYSDQLLKHFLDTVTPVEIAKINGIFPRSYEEMTLPLQHVQSLATLEPRIRDHCHQRTSEVSKHGGSRRSTTTSEDEICEYMRVLGCAKLCAHDDGLHHFSVFYNHSCEPNCEVRGKHNMEIFANRDIEAGEELCISYFGNEDPRAPSLDWPAQLRTVAMRKGWGVECGCTRCRREFKDDACAVQYDEPYWITFQTAVIPILNDPSSRFTFLRDPTLKQISGAGDWESVVWKEIYLLSHFECRLNAHLEGHGLPFMMRATPGLCKELQEWDALRLLMRLLELRKCFTNAGSFFMHRLYQTLWWCLGVYGASGCACPEVGLETVAHVQEMIKEVEQWIANASGSNIIRFGFPGVDLF